MGEFHYTLFLFVLLRTSVLCFASLRFRFVSILQFDSSGEGSQVTKIVF